VEWSGVSPRSREFNAESSEGMGVGWELTGWFVLHTSAGDLFGLSSTVLFELLRGCSRRRTSLLSAGGCEKTDGGGVEWGSAVV
jgi:hypothetical protein